MRTLADADLLVLDDLFLAGRISDKAGELLQTLVHQRYKVKRSIVVTSNWVVQDWGKYHGDNTMETNFVLRPGVVAAGMKTWRGAVPIATQFTDTED